MPKGVITALYQYPVKSMAGMSCRSALATPSGFEWDRRWMLIDDNNHMITQREIPELCRFFPSLSYTHLHIQYGENRCSIELNETMGDVFISKVWDDETRVVGVSESMDKWLSQQLKQSVRLVKVIERFHFATPLNATIEVSGADGYPYLILGSASIDHLIEQSGEPIDIRRFRPNIVLTTSTPHEEDDWANLLTQSVNLQKVKPCLRCQIIDFDPDSGQRKGAVTRTLSQYRRMGNNIGFGASYMGLNKGELVVGEAFWVD